MCLGKAQWRPLHHAKTDALRAQPLNRGLETRAVATNNRRMIKQTQIYGWDEEPADERPSEFMHSTTHAGLSGFHPMNDPMRRRRSNGRFGFKSLLAFCAVVLALGVVCLMKVAPLLHP